MKKISAIDVARAAGVSQAAVSRAFTPGAPIAPEKQRHILSVAGELGYTPRLRQPQKAGNKAREVAVVATDISNPFFPPIIELLLHNLRQCGRTVQLHCVPKDVPLDTVIPELFRHRPDGVILAAATFEFDLVEVCRSRGVPIVLINRFFEHHTVSMVACDNYLGGRQVADLLVRAGCRRTAFIAGRKEIPSSAMREQGLKDGLKAADMDVFARFDGNFSYEKAAEVARVMLKGHEIPDAVFCANDLMALAVVDVATREYGIAVPKDLAIVGFDDIPQAAWPPYRLTTVRQRLAVMVNEAIDLLERLVSHPDCEGMTRLVPGVLIERATTPALTGPHSIGVER